MQMILFLFVFSLYRTLNNLQMTMIMLEPHDEQLSFLLLYSIEISFIFQSAPNLSFLVYSIFGNWFWQVTSRYGIDCADLVSSRNQTSICGLPQDGVAVYWEAANNFFMVWALNFFIQLVCHSKLYSVTFLWIHMKVVTLHMIMLESDDSRTWAENFHDLYQSLRTTPASTHFQIKKFHTKFYWAGPHQKWGMSDFLYHEKQTQITLPFYAFTPQLA